MPPGLPSSPRQTEPDEASAQIRATNRAPTPQLVINKSLAVAHPKCDGQQHSPPHHVADVPTQ